MWLHSDLQAALLKSYIKFDSLQRKPNSILEEWLTAFRQTTSSCKCKSDQKGGKADAKILKIITKKSIKLYFKLKTVQILSKHLLNPLHMSQFKYNLSGEKILAEKLHLKIGKWLDLKVKCAHLI